MQLVFQLSFLALFKCLDRECSLQGILAEWTSLCRTAWTAPNSAIRDASKSFNLKIIIIVIISLHEDDGAL